MILILTILISIFYNLNSYEPYFCPKKIFTNAQNCDTDWLIVGAGPAGIITIGVLLDLGVLPNRITWLDPEFNVGRLANYSYVPANTKNKLFIDFLEKCVSLKNCAEKEIAELRKLDMEKEYPLDTIIKPLKAITNCLKNKINTIQGNLKSLYFENNSWKIITEDKNISSYYVVLATGSHPKKLNYEEFKEKEIPLDIAIDKFKLLEIIKVDDIVAVVGSSHSAILILKYLSEMQLNKIYNFYNKPIEYAVEMDGWLLNSEKGLKGITAEWAKNVLEKNPPKNLERIISNDENLKKFLQICTKIIYAVGFEKNNLPSIKENPNFEHDPSTGIIASRLFGIGIAFPGKYIDPLGNVEYKVGLNSFMEYAQKLVPCWIEKRSLEYNIKQKEILSKFEELFNIEIL